MTISLATIPSEERFDQHELCFFLSPLTTEGRRWRCQCCIQTPSLSWNICQNQFSLAAVLRFICAKINITLKGQGQVHWSETVVKEKNIIAVTKQILIYFVTRADSELESIILSSKRFQNILLPEQALLHHIRRNHRLMPEMRSEPFQYLATEQNNYMEWRISHSFKCGITSEAGIEGNGMKSVSQKTICKMFND